MRRAMSNPEREGAGRASQTPHPRPLRRLLLLVAVIGLITAYGIVGYMLIGFGFVDALFMTSLALTTAGFTPAGVLDGAAKVFTVSLAVLGVTTFFAVLGVFGSVLVERQFTTSSRRRRMDKRIQALHDHFVVCAYGRVGRTVTREYESEGVPFAVVDAKEELEEQMRADGVPYIIGDPSVDTVLRRAGVERARGLVCAVDSDAQNVYIALVARSLNPALYIVARAGEPGSAERLLRAGADRVVSPYVTSGRHMALISLRPRVLDSFDVPAAGGRDLRLDELRVEEGSSLVGQTLQAACGEAIPLLLRKPDGHIVPNPLGDQVLGGGDLILVFGEPRDLRSVEER